MPHNLPPASSPRSSGDALSALLDTEKVLQQRLDTASVEAQRILDNARTAAAEAERGLETASARELAALETARAKSLRDELELIATKARADRARFEGVGDSRIRELAARVVALVLRA